MKMKLCMSFGLCLLLFACSGDPDPWPLTINQAQADSVLQTGAIGQAELFLTKGKKKQKAILYLNEAGKSEKYRVTGYQDGEIGFFRVNVSNPYEFEKTADRFGVEVRKEIKK